jgi:hypothetical protein
MLQQRKDAFPYDRAMRKLFDQLIHAEQFYNFQSDYDNDITSIKKYATADLLDELWMLRVKGRKDLRAVFEGEFNEGEVFENQSVRFDDINRDLAHALWIAFEHGGRREGVAQNLGVC